MRICIHIGLHKTGTTYLQFMLKDAHLRLKECGIWFEPIAWYPAHHQLAWQILREDYRGIAHIMERAKGNDCHTLLISSEDLESLIFRSDVALHVEEELLRSGADNIEWHACLRRSDEYFWSLISETANHTYIDIVQSFFSVFKKGYLFIDGPPHWNVNGAPHWYHCFDNRHLQSFAERIGGTLSVCDFHQLNPYPGHDMLRSLGILDLLHEPNSTARNEKNSDDVRNERYASRFLEVSGLRTAPLILERLTSNLQLPIDLQTAMSDDLHTTFEPMRLHVLDAFCIARDTWSSSSVPR